MGKGLEKETIILYNEDEPNAEVFTYNVALQNKLLGLGVKAKDNGFGGMGFTVPKRWVKVSPPRRMSEEHLAKLHNAQSSPKSPTQKARKEVCGQNGHQRSSENQGFANAFTQGEFEA